LKAKFGVDTDKYGLSYMIAFGYRKADPANPKTRRNIEDIVTWL
jgi:nitroreductase